MRLSLQDWLKKRKENPPKADLRFVERRPMISKNNRWVEIRDVNNKPRFQSMLAVVLP